MPPPLSPQVFSLLGALIEDYAGIRSGTGAISLFADRVSIRASEAGFTSLLDYYYYLRQDPGGAEELDTLLDVILVGETYFYREADQLEALLDGVLLPRAASSRKKPKVWCAACSTGEEPLTLAMLLAERDALGKVEIIASDLSRSALSRAKKGLYGSSSFRVLPASARRWFTLVGDQYRVDPELRRSIGYCRVNLARPAELRMLGTFDAILCRNVLIYFGDATTSRVVEGLTSMLRPQGHLLVGGSESLLRFGTKLRCEQRKSAFFYVKAPGSKGAIPAQEAIDDVKVTTRRR